MESLSDSQISSKLHYLPENPAVLYEAMDISSVLDLSFQLLREGRFPAFSGVVARSQTKGRGRHGRVWVSPPGHLYASLRLPDGPPYEGSLAPIALGYELSEALERTLQVKTLIKWPNDLLLERKKVAGVLLECREGAVVAGVGINLKAPPQVERGPGQPLPGAFDTDMPPLELWIELCKCIFFSYTQLNRALAPSWAEDYARVVSQKLHALGDKVTIKDAHGKDGDYQDLMGVFRGIDPSGALVLESKNGCELVKSGSLLTSWTPS